MAAFTLDMARVVKAAPGWYQGDFHCHTNHSDGALTPQELLQTARHEGLDFFAITDHNTIAAYPGFGEPLDLCVIPGIEITFKAGHFNIFGVDQAASWLAPFTSELPVQTQISTPIDFSTLMAQSAADGLLNSINHPLLVPWAWLDGQTDLRNLHCLEIWNDPSWPDNHTANPEAVAMWTRWLNAGYRITAIGGSDYHRPVNNPGVTKPPDRLGLPRTWVYAENLSGRAILDGLRRRQVIVSMLGPWVNLEAATAQGVYTIGSDLGAQQGPIRVSAAVAGGEFAGVARLLRNGEIVQEQPLTGAPLTLEYQSELDVAEAVWFRLDVLDPDGLLLTMTNPIFAGPQRTPAALAYHDFVELP
jgi:hypothetical protein